MPGLDDIAEKGFPQVCSGFVVGRSFLLARPFGWEFSFHLCEGGNVELRGFLLDWEGYFGFLQSFDLAAEAGFDHRSCVVQILALGDKPE